MRTALPTLITINFNRSQPYLRELIERFQIFDRQPSSQSANALLDSFIWNCSKKGPLFRIARVNSDDVQPKVTALPRSHFSTMFYQTRSRVPIRIYSAPSFTSRFSFHSAHMNHIESRSLIQRSYILGLFSSSEDWHMHLQYMGFNNKIKHSIRTGLTAPFLSKKLRYHLQSERSFYHFFFMNIPIRWS